MKKVFTLLLALLLGFSLSACGAKDDSIKFGVIGPTTGDYSMYGLATAQGAQMAADEIGTVLGLPLVVISYDSKGDPAEGVNAYNRLTQEDGIHALIGGTFSGVTLAVKDLAITDGLPVLSPTATNPAVTLDAANVFRACYTDSYQGAVAGIFAHDTLGLSKGAILYNKDDAYSEGLAVGFKSAFAGDVVAEEAWSAGDKDFSALLTNIAATDAQFLFVPGYVAEVGAILTQAESLGLNIPIIGGDGWDGVEEDYSDVAEGHYFGNHYAKSDPDQKVQDFVNNYTDKFGESPNALAALAYDAVYAMVAAFEAAGETDSVEVVAALQSLELDGLVTGDLMFDNNGDPVKAVTMIQLVDGQHVVVEKVSVG